jgi:AbrB family looped-hinge helix DNA binding protein
MTQAKVGARFQVVIPKKARERVHIQPHSTVDVTAQDGCIVIRPVHAGSFRGIGKQLLARESPGDYVKRLRHEWADKG